MHDAARDWVAAALPDSYGDVIELGSYAINGDVRDLLDSGVPYVGVDLRAGPNVDVEADATTWRPSHTVDLVLCLEVFEHVPEWRDLVVTAYDCLNPGGTFIATAAGPGRHPHSGDSIKPIRPEEYYKNIKPEWLTDSLKAAGFRSSIVDVHGKDVRCVAKK